MTIPSRSPSAPAGRGLTIEQALRRRASRDAVAFGLTEVLNYPFIGPADLDRCEIPSDDPRRNLVVLANPLSDEQPGIRTTLLPGLLNAAKRNTHGVPIPLQYSKRALLHFVGWGPQVPPRLPVDRRPSDAELNELMSALPTQRRHLGAGLGRSN